MFQSVQSRKWQLTINNPEELGLTREAIREKVESLNPDYWCASDEIGAENKTPHTHVFIYRKSPIRERTIENKFHGAHREHVRGSVVQNRDYIRKSGDWADTEKAETSVEGSFEEHGTVPTPQEERSPQRHEILKKIAEGATPLEIVEEAPEFALYLKNIEHLAGSYKSNYYKKNLRSNLKVHYWIGDLSLMIERLYSQYKPEEMCFVNKYNQHSFDEYEYQPVLVFEDFMYQIPIKSFTRYLNIYPVQLPARYQNKTACFDEVYILSELELGKQYPSVQISKPDLWSQFCKRISDVSIFHSDGSFETVSL